MLRNLIIGALAMLGCASAQTNSVGLLDPRDYHAFLAQWTPEDRPLCRVIHSSAEWSATLHPAATMGRNVFGPPDALFNNHVVLLLARAMPTGPTEHVFDVHSVTRAAKGSVVVDYAYTPPPAASSTMNWYFAAVVDKPFTGPAFFRENGHDVCHTIRVD